MWILELTVKHVPKIMKICALRNSQIVFSRGRGLIFQGFRHLQKLTKTASKWRLKWAQNQENVVQRLLKNSLEKHIQKTCKNVFEIPPKMRSKKVICLRFFEVWRQRCSQGAPKGSPRHLLGSNLREKVAKMETKCHEKVVFFRGSTEGQML